MLVASNISVRALSVGHAGVQVRSFHYQTQTTKPTRPSCSQHTPSPHRHFSTHIPFVHLSKAVARLSVRIKRLKPRCQLLPASTPLEAYRTPNSSSTSQSTQHLAGLLSSIQEAKLNYCSPRAELTFQATDSFHLPRAYISVIRDPH